MPCGCQAGSRGLKAAEELSSRLRCCKLAKALEQSVLVRSRPSRPSRRSANSSLTSSQPALE